MTQRLALPALLLLLLCAAFFQLGCDSADNPIAPSGSSLSISANPTLISLNGQSATLTITGFKPDGNPLNPNTQLTISTSLGVLRAANNINSASINLVTIDDNGRATAFLFGDGRQGTATVTVALTSGTDATEATVDVQIGDDASSQPVVTVTANPAAIALNESSTITVTAKNADQSPLVGSTAIVRTSLGSLSFDNGNTTDSNGVVTLTLTSNQSGQAEVTATVGSSAEAMATVEIGTTRKPALEISANPAVIDANGTDDDNQLRVNPNGESRITVIARDENGNPLGSGERISLTSNLGTVARNSSVGVQGGNPEITSINTDSNGEARFFFYAGTRAGSGGVTAILGNSDPANVAITITTAPATINLSLAEGEIPEVSAQDPQDLNLVIRVLDNQGQPLGGELVFFRTVPSAGIPANFVPSNGASTNTQGEATAVLDFSDVGTIEGIDSFDIIATVRDLDSDPPLTITVVSSP